MSITSRSAASAVLAGAAATLLILSGCQPTASRDKGASAAASPTTGPAIYCDKCQTTFTRVPVTGGSPRGLGGVIGYRTVAKHECDECRNVAVGVIQQGKSTKPGEIVHKCKICGGAMTVCHTS